MSLAIYPLRCHFTALAAVEFPAFAANAIRGGLGAGLVGDAPDPDSSVPFRKFFDVSWHEGPSGFRNAPRPFVLRAAHLNRYRAGEGERFHFQINCFGKGIDFLPHLVRALEAFAERGMPGMGPGRARMECMEQLGKDLCSLGIIWNPGNLPRACAPLEIDLSETSSGPEKVRIRFLTPTELKEQGKVGEEPSFASLFARILGRLSALCSLYGRAPLSLNFHDLTGRAGRVRTLRSDLHRVAAERYSKRTGHRHAIGGWVGEIDYAGSLGEFVPFLETARFTGVGRQTVWGKGEIAWAAV